MIPSEAPDIERDSFQMESMVQHALQFLPIKSTVHCVQPSSNIFSTCQSDLGKSREENNIPTVTLTGDPSPGLFPIDASPACVTILLSGH